MWISLYICYQHTNKISQNVVHVGTVGKGTHVRTDSFLGTTEQHKHIDYIHLYLFSSSSIWPLSTLHPVVSSSPLKNKNN